MVSSKKASSSAIFALTLGALGVVYGDIGTSPLYAVREIFFGHSDLVLNPVNILGVISLVIWAITLIVSFKYVVYVLRADNDGEGGVFALYSLLYKLRVKGIFIITFLLILAAGLLFGDGIITPAISVISAVEGLTVATQAFTPYVVPITLAILTGLFLIQSRGTHTIGKFFGPIIAVWFVVIAALGLNSLIHAPQILWALNPFYAVNFMLHHQLRTLLLVLGSVMLVVTGGEAMYADMGHFGRQPIRLSWFTAVYPALILNYLGQGAFLLTHSSLHEANIFFDMVPSWGIYPMVILATLATIIASQALITGAFSLAAQAISLQLIPYLKIVHTHHEHEGQIYVPTINWLLMIGCWALVMIFQSSSRLASAYGLAVSAVMVITSLGMFWISRYYWKWPVWKTFLLFVPLTLIDATFLTANSLKLFEGGFVPLSIGLVILFVMTTWNWGEKRIKSSLEQLSSLTLKELIKLRREASQVIPRTMVILSPVAVDSLRSKVPAAKQVFMDRFGLLPQHILFIHFNAERRAHVLPKNRYTVTQFYTNKGQGSITSVEVWHGFMENPELDTVLAELASQLPLIKDQPEEWLVHELRETLLPGSTLSWLGKIKYRFFKFLHHNTNTLDHYFTSHHLDHISVDIVPAKL